MKNGGAAFPSPGVVLPGLDPNARKQGAYEGMTLRDYFAAKALQGFMANKDRPQHFIPKDDAEWCFQIADAMLKARES